MYEYRGLVEKVHDGDTVTVAVDLGLEISHRITLRVKGINAPELPTPAGKISQGFLAGLILGKTVLLRTVKDRTEKYGRYLADLAVLNGDACGEWIGKLMVDSNNAVPWDGKGPRP